MSDIRIVIYDNDNAYHNEVGGVEYTLTSNYYDTYDSTRFLEDLARQGKVVVIVGVEEEEE